MNQRCGHSTIAPPFSITRAERRLHTELTALQKRLRKALVGSASE
jgi:hypothetical protein